MFPCQSFSLGLSLSFREYRNHVSQWVKRHPRLHFIWHLVGYIESCYPVDVISASIHNGGLFSTRPFGAPSCYQKLLPFPWPLKLLTSVQADTGPFSGWLGWLSRIYKLLCFCACWISVLYRHLFSVDICWMNEWDQTQLLLRFSVVEKTWSSFETCLHPDSATSTLRTQDSVT